MRVKSPDTPVLFMDATHPSYNSMPAYGWIPKGCRVEVAATAQRLQVNLNGALNAETHETIVLECNRLNADSTIALLRKIEAHYPIAPYIYVIADNAGYYRSKAVSEYLRHSRIRLEFLPPYSPNLNLIERLWKFMHKHTVYNRYYPTFRELREELLMFFIRLPEEFADSLSSLLTLNFKIVAPKSERMQAVA